MGLTLFLLSIFSIVFLLDFFYLSFLDVKYFEVPLSHFVFWLVFLIPLNAFIFKGFFWTGYLLVFPLFALTNTGFGDSLTVFTLGLFNNIVNVTYKTGLSSFELLFSMITLCYLIPILVKKIMGKEKTALIPFLTIFQISYLASLLF